MSQNFKATMPSLKSLVKAKQQRVEKHRRTVEKLSEWMPLQIDAIREERELAMIKLRRFIREREREERIEGLKRPELSESPTTVGP